MWGGAGGGWFFARPLCASSVFVPFESSSEQAICDKPLHKVGSGIGGWGMAVGDGGLAASSQEAVPTPPPERPAFLSENLPAAGEHGRKGARGDARPQRAPKLRPEILA